MENYLKWKVLSEWKRSWRNFEGRSKYILKPFHLLSMLHDSCKIKTKKSIVNRAPKNLKHFDLENDYQFYLESVDEKKHRIYRKLLSRCA